MSVASGAPESGRQSIEERLATGATWILRLAILPFLLLLLLAISRWHGGVTGDQYLLFYAIPTLAIAALVAVLRASGGVRIGVVFAVALSGVAVVALETILVLTFTEALPVPTVDPRSTLEIVQEIRDGGDHAYPTVPGNVLVDLAPAFDLGSDTVHPLTTAPGGTTAFLCNEGAPITYQGDRYGFNNIDSRWDDSTAVVLVGDSYVHGMCHPREGQLAAGIAERWPTLNLGIRGTGPLQQLGLVREFASNVKPRVLVWVYYEGNDPYDYSRERFRSFLTDYLDPSHSQELMTRSDSVDERYRVWLDSLFDAGFHGRDLVAEVPLTARLAQVPRGRMVRRLVRFGTRFPSRASVLGALPEAVIQAREDVEAWGGTFYFVYLTAYERYNTLIGEGPGGRSELLAALDAAGVTVIDLDPVFEATGDPRALWDDPRGHLTLEGNRIASAEIARAIEGDLR